MSYMVCGTPLKNIDCDPSVSTENLGFDLTVSSVDSIADRYQSEVL